MAGNNGGPWGGSGSGGGRPTPPENNDNNQNDGTRRPAGNNRPNGMPDIDDLVRKGQDQLRVLMGGKGDGPRRPAGGAPGGGPSGPMLTRGTVLIGLLVVFALWLFASFYTVRPEERSVELFLGKYSAIGEPGLNFAPWPLVTHEVISVTSERNVDIGVAGRSQDAGLMLTGDENIVDIDFQVVWNINDPAKFLFNLRDPQMTITAVSTSAMREIIAQSELSPILNRDRGAISGRLQDLIQSTLDSYNSGMNVIRVNFDKADPPAEVIDAFREVQAAEQERERLTNQADAYANRVTAAARGEAAQIMQQAEGYRAQTVNEAEGEASRFSAVLNEYRKAPEVTRKRLYIEAMEDVLGDVNKVLVDGDAGNGVLPYLPLNQLAPGSATAPAAQSDASK
ncbi:FtsH protease activity modulator HflK [Pseudooceanicola sediminis]|uniref:Protein HflK n=1 Tax=Pseudooceanicola sediminis TaxID=2211117 RepID=A0A399IZ69_9RHOB|nr:FtsH protease activity modulator HflK [Pseudooceanicola sediminis]KAA2311476.1 FtsH protease activity modulator HflK [Puniceibacterium sp. HSS470]RII36892.1 FtsH protease activity modulator HflK [Pseudooceanicola sediminis]|tara:strand:+ start:5999 stop:7186 length:1188 start_codon:yes stop_codon:yes gene_type:complete